MSILDRLKRLWTKPTVRDATPPAPAVATEADLLRAAMTKAGILDNETRAGVAAIVMGESGMKGYSEGGYSGTSNRRIREVFGFRVQMFNDDELDALKASDRAFFNHVYGAAFQHIHRLGNIEPGDGYAFRGRGFLQLTGRANYDRYGGMLGRDLIGNPDLANEPAVAAELAAAYIKDRYKGGGWEALLQCVGNQVANVKAKKTEYRRQFLASGEYDYRPVSPGA
jgi:predicted chitinase